MHAHPNLTRPRSRFILAAGCLACLVGCIEPLPNSPQMEASDSDAEAPAIDAEVMRDGQLSDGDLPAPDAEPLEADAGFFPDAETPDPADAAPLADDGVPEVDAEVDDRFPGSFAESCGSPTQDLEPIDCTAQGDEGAFCVFSNHCLCSDGFVCEGASEGGECEPGVICVPE